MDFSDLYPPAENATATEKAGSGVVERVKTAAMGIRPEYVVIALILVLVVLRLGWERGK